MDSDAYISPTKKKTLIQNPTAINNYKSWKKSHEGDEERMEHDNVKVYIFFQFYCCLFVLIF